MLPLALNFGKGRKQAGQLMSARFSYRLLVDLFSEA